ncbi:hypothetical protein [Marinicella litoralis]|uniref:Uncharacterized protein n=1 Tax=Marinicella litoralis TaxID=644220 RepID=A0A4R6X6G0_9GAMM|nr:hypothetical protein [Marinicella litoralis]TDR14645.1 hypothetical protein C8D91_2916 [Marinicella litoralis]
MKHVGIWVLLFCLGLGSAQAKRLGLFFDTHGNMISPDDYLVHQALKDDEGGYKNDAMWRLQEAGEYGNKHGQYYAGLLYLQQGDYVNGYAWLKLAGEDFMNNSNLLPSVSQTLNSRGLMNTAKQTHHRLNEQINFESTIAKRVDWFKKLKFAGSHIGGYIPVFWRTEMRDGVVVKGFDLRQDIKSFLFDYRYQQGDVRLTELELDVIL